MQYALTHMGAGTQANIHARTQYADIIVFPRRQRGHCAPAVIHEGT